MTLFPFIIGKRKTFVNFYRVRKGAKKGRVFPSPAVFCRFAEKKLSQPSASLPNLDSRARHSRAVRALHLIISNVGGSRPGITDMSTLGQPGDFAMFLAENADASPWPSFHTEYGFLPERNVVTVAAVEGYSGIMGIGYSRPEYLDLIAAWLRGHDRPYRRSIILLVAQDTAQMLAREGWTREAMRQYIRERARIPFGEWNRQYHGAKEARKGVPEEVFAIADPNELVDKPFFDSMPIIVAGGTGEKSMLLPCWASGKMVSQEIRLPASWGEGVR